MPPVPVPCPPSAAAATVQAAVVELQTHAQAAQAHHTSWVHCGRC